MMNIDNYRILGENLAVSNDTWETQNNNNDLIIGTTGSGKTRSYVMTNILNSKDSMIITDTKGNLYKKLNSRLKEKGFDVKLIDFTNFKNSTVGYNPFDFLGYDEDGIVSELDIRKLSKVVCPRCVFDREPFWQDSARDYMECMVSYVKDFTPENEHHFGTVYKLATLMDSGRFTELMRDAEEKLPDGLVAKRYPQIISNAGADRMHASIKGFVYQNLSSLNTKEAVRFYKRQDRIDFKELGKKPTALFLIVSDTDRSQDVFINLLYTQALQELVRFADLSEGSRLPVPVRFFLDDFASNFEIPDFDKIISVIRSREISVSLMIQCIEQLTDIYGRSAGTTILENCGTQIYLGGQDPDTANYFGRKLNKTESTVLSMPRDMELVFIYGQKPIMNRKFDFGAHEAELMSSESDKMGFEMAV